LVVSLLYLLFRRAVAALRLRSRELGADRRLAARASENHSIDARRVQKLDSPRNPEASS
jgi:hypothetical protein